MKDKLQKFVEDNNLVFYAGSGGDSNILALCGYATFINASLQDCIYVAKSESCNNEIKRVYEYAKKNNYSKFWKTKAAKEQYVF